MMGRRSDFHRTSRGQLANEFAPGERHGLVTVVRRVMGAGGARYLVRCDCGTERYVHGGNLRKKPPKTHRSCEQARAAEQEPGAQ
jgi:hypothetical protein